MRIKLWKSRNAVPEISKATRDAWWSVFTNALYMGVEDGEDLMRARDPEVARKMARSARNIADSAIEEYESRFGM